MRWFIPLLLLLGACTSVQTVKDTIAVKGAQTSDQVLIDAEWWVCSAATVGAVKRRYGTTAERADLYREFCDGSGTANVVTPVD